MNGNIVVPMTSEHLPAVVQTHLASFPDFFLSFLGSRFLTLYYAGVCSAHEGIGFVYLNTQGTPVGFVAGSSNPRGFYKRLLRRDWMRFSIASAGAIVRKPSIIKRVARGLFHPGNNPVGVDVAGLFSLGVLPELQGMGFGRELITAFMEEARKRGCKKIVLATDRDDNERANRFYQKIGFRIERQYVTPEGRRMNGYEMGIL